MKELKCSIEDCINISSRKGYCLKHYTRMKRHGDPLICNIIKWNGNYRQFCLYHNAKSRANRFKLPFNLEPNDLIIPKTCPILDIPLIHAALHKPTDNSPTLDRIIPALGYVKGNVHVISHLANRIKNSATPEQLLKVALYFQKEK